MSMISLSLLLSLLLNALLGTYVLLNSKKNDRGIAINFFLFALLFSFWIFTFFLSSLQISYSISLIAARLSSIGALFFSFHFMLFSFGITLKKFPRHLVFVFYAFLSLISFIAISTSLYIKDIVFSNMAYDYILGSFYFVIPLLLMIFMGRGLFSLIIYFNEADSSKKNQIKYLIIGMFIAFFAGFISNILLPYFGIRSLYFGGPLSTIFFVLFATYAITKHHLMDITVIIRKSLVYTLVTGVFTGLYLLILIILSNLFGNLIGSNIIATLVILVAFAFGFQPLKDHVQQKIDKIFFKGKYDYQQTLKNISSASVTILNLEELLNHISTILYQTINPASIHILLLDSSSKEYKEKSPPFKTLGGNSKLLAELFSKRLPLLRDDLLKENTNALDAANAIEAFLSIPLFSQNTLIGLIALGPKKNEDPYNDEDINLLSTLANHLATSIENSLLHEEALLTQKKLIQADKLSSLGTMAAGMAHEIKNPISIVKGLAQLTKKAFDNNDKEFIEQYQDIVPKELDRINVLVENLLKFSKPPKAVLTNCDLNQVLKDSILLFAHQLKKKNVELIEELNEIPTIKADADQLQQVFSNLILNAIDAMPNGGKLSIKTYQNGNQIVAEIADSGVGIPEANLKNIFDPFFTTKSKGNGLGLAVSFKIIEEHNAAIEVESVTGKGTTFRIKFNV